MAASKSARKQPITRSDHKSVSQSGGRTKSRESVAGGATGRRETPEKRRTPKAAVPPVQPTVEVVGPERGERYQLVPEKALLSAFARATINVAKHPVKWDAENQWWVVKSATDTRRDYCVWRRRSKRGRLPFYVILECNCQAEQSGSYLVCWHKCAVKLWLNEWFAKRSFGDQLDEATEGEWEGDTFVAAAEEV